MINLSIPYVNTYVNIIKHAETLPYLILKRNVFILKIIRIN